MKHLKTYKMFELLSIRDQFAKDFVFPSAHIQNIINDILIDLMDEGVHVELSPWDYKKGFTLAIGDENKENIYWKEVKGYVQHLIKALSEEDTRLTGIHIGTFTYDNFDEVEDCSDRSTPEGKELEIPHDLIYLYFTEKNSSNTYTTYILKENYEFTDIEYHTQDILAELEDEGLNFGTKVSHNNKRLEVVIANRNDIKISNYEVFKYIKRLIESLRMEGYDAYEILINSKKMGSAPTDSYEPLDDYLALSPKEKIKSNQVDGNNFRYMEISLFKQKVVKEAKRSYSKEDYHNLEELYKDVDNIMLDISDEYSIKKIDTNNIGHETNWTISQNENSYTITHSVKPTRHGMYGVVKIKINCDKLLEEFRIGDGVYDIDELPDSLRELMVRLNTIGHSENMFVSPDNIMEIKVIPRD